MNSLPPDAEGDRDPARDAWLRQALRHAPDADAAPPAALRETILRQARAATAKVRPSTVARPADRLAAVWAWLARPPVAAGFASVMVATLVGLMWWDRPLDETLPRPPAPASPPPSAAPSTPPVAAARDAAQAPARPPNERSADAIPRAQRAAASSAARAAAAAPAAVPKPVPAPARAVIEPRREDAAARRVIVAPAQKEEEAKAKRAEAPAAAPTLPAPAPQRTEPAPFTEPHAADGAAVPATVAPSGRLGAPVERSSSEPVPIVREQSRADANVAGESAAAADSARQQTLAKAAAPLAAAPAMSALSRSRAPTVAAGASSTAFAPLAEALASIRSQPERWSWQRTDAERPMNPALQRWLAEFDRASAARWQVDSGPPPVGNELRLFRDGRLRVVLRFAEPGVWLLLAPSLNGPSRSALSPATLAELARTLDDAAP